jgi:hypothetical protein
LKLLIFQTEQKDIPSILSAKIKRRLLDPKKSPCKNDGFFCKGIFRMPPLNGILRPTKPDTLRTFYFLYSADSISSRERRRVSKTLYFTNIIDNIAIKP